VGLSFEVDVEIMGYLTVYGKKMFWKAFSAGIQL
jgi:hypothetical protein